MPIDNRHTLRRARRRGSVIVPFIDGVRVRQGAGNLYNAGVWFAQIKVDDIGGYVSTEMFFQFAQPVTDIKSISFPWADGAFSASNSSSEFGTTQQGVWTPRVGMNLMLFDMALGQPLGLDALTGANAAWGENSSAHGSLYATASNFDDFGGVGAELWSAPETTEVSDIVGGTTKMGVTSLGWAADPTASNAQMLGISFSPAKTAGPYFGIHVFFHSRDLANDPIFAWKGTIDYTISANLLSPRPGIPTVRGHVIGTPLLSF